MVPQSEKVIIKCVHLIMLYNLFKPPLATKYFRGFLYLYLSLKMEPTLLDVKKYTAGQDTLLQSL